MATQTPQFPIEEAVPALMSTLEASYCTVLSAPPGAGKTTRVPLALLNAGWLGKNKILMLEPRRLAARRAASFMAQQLGERVGQTIGYRIRGDAVVSDATRVEVVTEGILTRMLHANPELPGVGLVIFDEYHERSIHADLGLAFTIDVQKHLPRGPSRAGDVGDARWRSGCTITERCADYREFGKIISCGNEVRALRIRQVARGTNCRCSFPGPRRRRG